MVIRKTVVLRAEASKVWEVIVNPRFTIYYMFGCAVDSDWREGGRISYFEETGEGRVEHARGVIVSIDPGRYLRHTSFAVNSGLVETPENHTVITYELVPDSGMTALSITQENFAGDARRFNNSSIGWEYVINALKAIFDEESR